MDFRSLLAHAKNGGGILFCGAGYSADCLNFNHIEELGTTGALLELLNQELENAGQTCGFRDVKNAADEYREKIGEFELMQLLKQRFSVAHLTDDTIEIASFPWDRIYTTNYDNALELGCTRADRPFNSANNLDSVSSSIVNAVDIVHLHGCADKWTTENFEKSCILGVESYLRLETIKHWLDQLRTDFDRSTIVVFVGFAAQDFHLNQVLFNASGTKPKVFFVNPPAARPEPDLERTQRSFGNPLAIGRQGLSAILREIVQSDLPEEPALRCFDRYHLAEQAPDVPRVVDIENQLVFGELLREHIVRDVLQVSVTAYMEPIRVRLNGATPCSG